MKPFIVVSDGMDERLFGELVSIGEFHVHPKSLVDSSELESLLPDVSGLVVRSKTKIRSDILAMAPRLRYVIRAGEGTDNIDKAACATRGIKVSNTPGANNNAAAEHTLALMLTVLRHTAHAHRSMQEGGWEKDRFVGLELAGKTIGVVGLGKIGTLVAKRLAGFEPNILYFDPSVKESPLFYARHVPSLEELFRSCDIVTIHVPLTRETEGLIDGRLIGMMPNRAVLINAARGGVVDEEALYQALLCKGIRGAGLDVYASGTLEQGSKLRGLHNIVLTPHLGASTEEAQMRVGRRVVDLLKDFFLKGSQNVEGN